jgi:hypothetical protein
MGAMTVVPGIPGTAAVDEVADPAREQGSIDPLRWPAKLARTEEGTQWLCALKTTL